MTHDAPAQDNITGLILAGGGARRLGGVDKGLTRLHGKPLIDHVLARLQPQVANIIISANRNQATYQRYASVVLPDADNLPTQGGPLVGIATALRHVTTPWLAVAPCDTPCIPHDLVSRLSHAVQLSGKPLAVAVAEGKRHSVCMLVHRETASSLEAYLARGERKVEQWQNQAGVTEVTFAHGDEFANFNHPNDFTQAETATLTNSGK